MTTYVVNLDTCRTLDTGPILIDYESIVVQGLEAFDVVHFRRPDGPGRTTLRTREVYPTWTQDLSLIMEHADFRSTIRQVMVGSDVIRLEVNVSPPGVWVWHRDFLLNGSIVFGSPVDRLRAGLCPVCGTRGEFRRMALCCPTHGVYAGI